MIHTKPISRLMRWLALFSSAAIIPTVLHAQGDAEKNVFELSPLNVDASGDVGYRAMNTLSGSRLNSSLKDTAAPVSVFTQEFLDDLGLNSIEDVADWAVGTQVYYNEDDPNQNELMFSGAAPFKVRGLDASRSRNFFPWNVSIDTYNSERLELSSGANSILFGLGSPGGLIDSGTKKAQLHRDSLTLKNEFGSNEHLRNSIDLNKVLVEDRLAIRINYLNQRKDSWRDWVKDDADRFHIAGTFRIAEDTFLRAEYEKGELEQIIPRTYSAFLSHQPLEALRIGTGIDQNALYNSVTNPYGLYDPYTDGAGNVLAVNANLTRAAVADTVLTQQVRGRRMVYSQGYLVDEPFLFDAAGQVRSRRKNPIETVWDDPYITNETWIMGDVSTRDENYDTHSLQFEHKLMEGLYLETAYNKQSTDYDLWSSGGQNGIELYHDLNATLPNGDINPRAGQLYSEAFWQHRVRELERETYHGLLSYELDFTERNKWFGLHRFASLWEESETSQQNNRLSTVVEENNLRGFNAGNADSGANRIWYRTYYDRDDLDSFVFAQPPQLTNEPVRYQLSTNTRNNFPAGTEINTFLSPSTAEGNLVNDQLSSKMLVMQNFWLDGRLVTAYGARKEKLDSLLSGPQRGGAADLGRILGTTDNLTQFSNISRNFGTVLHLNKGKNLSLFYNQGNNFATPRPEHQVINVLPPVALGNTKDIGIKFDLFDGKLQGSVVKYETSGINSSENQGTHGPVNNLTDRLLEYNNMFLSSDGVIDPIWGEAEATAIFGTPNGRFNSLDGQLITDDNVADLVLTNTAVVFDVETEGYEYQLTANLSDSFTLIANYAESQTNGASGGDEWISYLDGFMPYAEAMLDENDTAAELAGLNDLHLVSLENIQRTLYTQTFQRNGENIRGTNPGRLNVLAKHTWREGLLKGFALSGGLQWRDGAVVGNSTAGGVVPYTVDVDGDNSISRNEYKAWESLKPFDALERVPTYGSDQIMYNMGLGYRTKVTIGERKADLLFQLNVKNLFDNNDPVVTQFNPSDNSITRYRFVEPRTVTLTTTLKF